MSAVMQEQDWFMDLVQRSQPMLTPVHQDWLVRARQRAEHALLEMPRPHRKQEAWRYTNVDKLLQTRFEPVANEWFELQWRPHWILGSADSYRLLFVNGRLRTDYSSLAALEKDIRLGSLPGMLNSHPELVNGWFGQGTVANTNIFAVLNTALLNDGVLVHIPRNVKLDKPIEILYVTLGEEQALASQLRNLVVLEAGAEATLIERFVSPGTFSVLNNSVSEVLLEDGARLNHYRLQEENQHSYHLAQIDVRQARDSHYQNVNLALGAVLARTDLNVNFAGEGAHSELDGLYVVGDQQQIDTHLNVVHRSARGASRENYKGILLGKGRAVFDGRIEVAKDAQQTDAHLSNKNLLLSRDAEVDTKPQLEIYADNVKCSHGTTVGQIDPNQLFYLRARGIDAVQAQKLLCQGFAGEILERIEIENLRNHVNDRLAQKLKESL